MVSPVTDFLNGNGIPTLRGCAQRVAVALEVSRVPWGEARAVEEVLSKGCGTCTGKHALLQACFDHLGTASRNVVCSFRWGDQAIQYSDALWKILGEADWGHSHNFLQVKNSAGEWIDLDVTWDPPLAPYGFRALPEDWDGESGFMGMDRIIRRWDGTDVARKKEELLAALTEGERAAREQFLGEFIRWIASLRRV